LQLDKMTQIIKIMQNNRHFNLGFFHNIQGLDNPEWNIVQRIKKDLIYRKIDNILRDAGILNLEDNKKAIGYLYYGIDFDGNSIENPQIRETIEGLRQIGEETKASIKGQLQRIKELMRGRATQEEIDRAITRMENMFLDYIRSTLDNVSRVGFLPPLRSVDSYVNSDEFLNDFIRELGINPPEDPQQSQDNGNIDKFGYIQKMLGLKIFTGMAEEKLDESAQIYAKRIVQNLDSYQITRLAHMIVKREKGREEVSYSRDLSAADRNLTADKLHEIAAEVKRIQEENGFIRTLEQCYYAVLDFFRGIFSMTTLDKDRKRCCEFVLYVTRNPAEQTSFVNLVGSQRDDQAAPQVV